jgi:hypothetical protein
MSVGIWVTARPHTREGCDLGVGGYSLHRLRGSAPWTPDPMQLVELQLWLLGLADEVVPRTPPEEEPRVIAAAFAGDGEDVFVSRLA